MRLNSRRRAQSGNGSRQFCFSALRQFSRVGRNKTTDTASFLAFLPAPLTKRTRTDAVTSQLAALGRLSRTQALRRAEGLAAGQEPLARETLVALLRACRRAGDADAERRVLDSLLRRLRPAIKARVWAWRTLAPAGAEDGEREAIALLVAWFLSDAPSEEFWECNFEFTFNRRLISALKAVTRRRVPTLPATLPDGDGGEWDRLADQPDPAAETAFLDVEARDSLALLSRADPRLAEAAFLLREGFLDAEIAAQLGVTDRTLRNWKGRMRVLLRQE